MKAFSDIYLTLHIVNSSGIGLDKFADAGIGADTVLKLGVQTQIF